MIFFWNNHEGVSWEDNNFILGASTAATDFYEQAQLKIDG